MSSDRSAAQVEQRASNAEMVRQRRAPAPTGQVQERGSDYAVCLGRSFSVPVDEVWSWLTSPDRVRIWLGEAETGRRRFRLAGATLDAPALGYDVEHLDAPTRLVLTLRDDSAGRHARSWRIDVTLTGTPQGSHLMLEQIVADPVAAPSVAAACEFYLDRLVHVCHGQPLTDLDHDDYFLSQGPAYRQMFPLPRGHQGGSRARAGSQRPVS